MRIEYVNKITGRTGFKELPPRLNPVRIGHHPDNHLVLESPQVGLEAGVLDNDVGGGEGWRFWNRSGKPIRVDGKTVTSRNEYLRLNKKVFRVDLGPYSLTISLGIPWGTRLWGWTPWNPGPWPWSVECTSSYWTCTPPTPATRRIG